MSWRDDPITEKQKNYIRDMWENAGMNDAIIPEFYGTTKGEASDYISKYKYQQYESFDFDSHGDNYGDRI